MYTYCTYRLDTPSAPQQQQEGVSEGGMDEPHGKGNTEEEPEMKTSLK